MILSGWGRYPIIKTDLKSPKSIKELVNAISKNDAVARGNGRSYGDSAISKNNTILIPGSCNRPSVSVGNLKDLYLELSCEVKSLIKKF